jgi:hypothetical protein
MIDSLSSEELQFIKAIEKYKSEHQKHFLSWTEVLKILKELGYKKIVRRPPQPVVGPAKPTPAARAPAAGAPAAAPKR